MSHSNVYYQNRKDRLRIDRGYGVARAYGIWTGMRTRIRNPLRNPKNGLAYVGLSIAPEWDDFEKFLQDMGEPPAGHSIDRIDNTKGYSKGNCRWADATTQSRNRNYVKLNPEAVKVLRYLYSSGKFSQQRLADVYSVSQVLVSLIVRNEEWA